MRSADARNIAMELLAWRREQQLSQNAAARELGVPVAALKRWESGAPCPLWAMIETAMGVPVVPKLGQRNRRMLQ